MAEASKSVTVNQEFANDFQQKTEMYFLALIFTVIALVIQSAKFSGDRLQWTVEIAGWVVLIVTGILALVRVTWVPLIFRYSAEMYRKRDLLNDAENAPDDTHFQPEDKVLTKPQFLAYLTDIIAKAEAEVDKITNKTTAAYKWQFRLFILGIVLVGVARAYGGFPGNGAQIACFAAG